MGTASRRWHVEVTGHVQGVGFRPFAKRLANQWQLAGWARNAGGFVELEVQGDLQACNGFVKELVVSLPRPAQIRCLDVKEIKIVLKDSAFSVLASRVDGDLQRFVPKDIGICEDCRQELLDITDRRFGYPFINCCHCGPRYTIINKLPYDRERTSMRKFPLCLDCSFEYATELDRRFHAEPNACAECGPQYIFNDNNSVVSGRSAVDSAILTLAEGKILAIKGIGGFHLAALANCSEAIARIRQIKSRPDKPLAVMVSDMSDALKLGKIDTGEAELLDGPDCPIVLLDKASFDLAPNIAPGLTNIGVMKAYAPIHFLLLKEFDVPLVMTSANKGGSPIIINNNDALVKLKNEVDAFFSHNRSISNGCDDSVVRKVAGRTMALRLGRGRAPHALELKGEYSPILACGADLKNTFALAANGWAHISQHLGDLSDLDCFDRYQQTIKTLCGLLDIEPQKVACDLHPDYVSVSYAESLGVPVERVQHHHAHIASSLAEKGIHEPVIGVAFDGSGWGYDDRIWGGEWLICDLQHMERVAHLKEVSMPGSEAAIRFPWRMALSYLVDLQLEHDAIVELLGFISEDEINAVRKQISSGINMPLTSSCGRLFEAVSSLVLGCRSQSFEGQAASYLESAVSSEEEGLYQFALAGRKGMIEVDYTQALTALIADKQVGTPPAVIAARFHNGLADVLATVSERLRAERGINKVVLGGGVFANAFLYTKAIDLLEGRGFQVVTAEEVPINDGGISFGQAAVVAAGGGAGANQI